MDSDEARIIRAVLSGDVDRYAELVDKYQSVALRVAFSLLGNDEDAKDAAQEAFVDAYRSLARFRGGAKFSTWLFRIVVNACKDARKRQARRPMVVASIGEPDPQSDEPGLFIDVEDPAASPSDRLANQELAHRLSAAIGTLPMKQRTAFLLRHVHGLALEDVAAVMASRVGTVKSHVFRAVQSLQTQLSSWQAKEGRP